MSQNQEELVGMKRRLIAIRLGHGVVKVYKEKPHAVEL